MVLAVRTGARFILLQKVLTEKSYLPQLHSNHADNSYKTMLAKVYFSDSESVEYLASNLLFFILVHILHMMFPNILKMLLMFE